MRIEISKKIPSWHRLSFFSRSPIFKTSIIIMFIIPIWARLANNIDSQTDNYTHYVIGFLDNKIPAIPNNLLRIFWASLSTNIAYILYTFFCPKIIKYKNFQHWLDEDEEAISNYNTEIGERGRTSEDNVIKDLKDKYQKEINQSNYHKEFLRFLISLLYIFSSIMMGYVMLYQIIPVLIITDLVKLISPYTF